MRHVFQTYIEEGRLRGLYLCVSLCLAICTCYIYSTELLFLCVRPLLYLDKSFIFTELTEAFYVTVKVCVLWSLGFTVPLLFYQLWCFVAPSCFPLERGRWGGVCWTCGCLTVVAIVGTYTMVLPQAAAILITFEVVDPIVSIQLEARIGPYIDLSLRIVMVAIVSLQLPLVFGFCFHLGVLDPYALTNNRKLLLLSSLLVAALVSPPEASTQCLLALMLNLCWEGVALLGFLIFRLKGSNGHITQSCCYQSCHIASNVWIGCTVP